MCVRMGAAEGTVEGTVEGTAEGTAAGDSVDSCVIVIINIYYNRRSVSALPESACRIYCVYASGLDFFNSYHFAVSLQSSCCGIGVLILLCHISRGGWDSQHQRRFGTEGPR